ncbi:MAG: hypothetical protein DRI46_10445 [Chloroflexi bacterium]|nr:MAG: hypothetical protein DRI46_10445 [Chloroflexota bacterium]
MISEGTHTAKPTAWGLVERGQFLKAMIEFKTDNDEVAQWTGSIENDDFVKYTLENVRTCGYEPTTGDDLKNLFITGTDNGLLDTDGAVDIVVEHSEGDTKTYVNVRYINKAGSRRGGALSAGEAAERLKGVNLDALFKGKRASQAPQPAKESLDDLPF